ncbi:MAG: response regulator [Prolixibacteraceae bacterium]|nr:response regulator [Prolixibacteraceae bacterium]
MNTKLKCLLLDDELPGLSYLKLICEQIPQLEVVKTFNDPLLFLDELPKLNFDLCILDIEMPGINGIQLAGMLKGKQVIFTTAYKDFATDAFDLDAIDYIIKPIKPERLKHAVEKAIQLGTRSTSERHSIHLNTSKGNTQLYTDQLVYVRTSEIDSRDKVAVLSTGEQIQLKNISFGKLAALLPPAGFCQVNKKEMIAVESVLYFSLDQITTNIYLQPEKPLVITLGESYRNAFIEQVGH